MTEQQDQNDLPTGRMQAANMGLHHYTGAPCRKCGATLRYTATGNCVSCAKESVKTWRQKVLSTLRENKTKPAIGG